jgi:lysozyme
MPRDLSEALRLVSAFEGCRLQPYADVIGVATIGYGHVVCDATDRPLRGPTGLAQARAKYPIGLSQGEACDLLASDFCQFAVGVERLVTVALTDQQLGALASFAFNVGLGNFKSSTLLRRLNAGQYDVVPGELAKWTRAGGVVLNGLIRRRRAEGRLWQGLPWAS